MKEKVSGLVQSAIACLQDYFKHNHEQQQRRRQEYENERKNQVIYNFMLQMRYDLFEVLRNQSYANIAPIPAATAIRIDSYRQINQGFVYNFRLAKKNDNKIIAILLTEIKQNLNRDIVATRADIVQNQGLDILFGFYPFLAHGLYVMKVYDTGVSDVIITVATNFPL